MKTVGLEPLVGHTAEIAVNRYWDARSWSDAGPDGACQGCEFLLRDTSVEDDDGWWCLLRSGIGTEKDCHKCPGIKKPNASLQPAARSADRLEGDVGQENEA